MTEPPMRGLPFETTTIVCTHVFERSRPVLYVTRPDGDWCFLCGDEHAAGSSDYCVVGLGHIVEHDPTLTSVLDLNENEEADRSAVGDVWVRSRF